METYIVWKNYGHDGWSPYEFKTLKECVDYILKENYGSEWKITKEIVLEIKAVEEKS